MIGGRDPFEEVRGGGGWISFGLNCGRKDDFDIPLCTFLTMVAGTSTFLRFCEGDIGVERCPGIAAIWFEGPAGGT
jgi:hypothetical protein